MKRFCLSVIFLSATLGFLHAAPCPIATLSMYEQFGQMGCTVGPAPTFTFKNFTFNPVGMSPLTADQILVTPTFNPTSLNLTFSSSGFQVSSGQFAEYLINYLVDPPPPEIIRFTSGLQDGPAIGNASSQVTTSLCIDPGCQRAASLIVFDMPSGGMVESRTVQLTDTTSIFPSTVYVQVNNDVRLDATSGGSAAINGFSNTTGIAPEPVSAVLVGGSLLALALWRARAKVR